MSGFFMVSRLSDGEPVAVRADQVVFVESYPAAATGPYTSIATAHNYPLAVRETQREVVERIDAALLRERVSDADGAS